MHDDGHFDERVAARYDASSAEHSSPEVVDPIVDRLAALAGGGRALEFGIGTGRIALPLARRGVPVSGIELSNAMVARLRAVFHLSERRWGIDQYDVVADQVLISHHVELLDGGVERFSAPFRYVWPAELDLMAEPAGLRLRERSAGWKREPFTGESRQHVSVWEKPRP